MADTRQFTDHNEIGGVNVYLEDKKLAESPEKNTVASTDYVLLKDTDGVPHKISKANMMSVVKDALADLLKSNDLGTSVTNVPVLNASAFGSATVANLASVLGGITKSMGANTDCNDMLDPSITYYWSANSPVHAPYAYGVLKTLIRFGESSFLQICIIRGNDPQFSMRTFYNNAWTAWKLFSLTNLE